MPKENKIPLGYVELPNGPKAIFPMNDIFLCYTFENSVYWEALRSAVNIIIDAYRQIMPGTNVKPIEGSIKVRTQFRHFLSSDTKAGRDQDIKITEDEGHSATYVEFQNRAVTDPPIEIRAVEYFGLGIGHAKGRTANQLWLLAEDVESVLHGRPFARYILKDEANNNVHPTASGIMYVSLTGLSQEKTPAGELALFLLGKPADTQNEAVKKITEALNSSFEVFKEDKEVVKMLSLAERYTSEGKLEGKLEGIAEGKIEGKLEGADKMFELIKSGLSPEEALCKVKEGKD